VSKAVTVAEITKRKLRGLHQNTQIGLAPAAAASAGSSTSKHPQPDISIVLSLEPLDPSRPGYQPPLTDEEILNACIDDDDQDCSAAPLAPQPTGAIPGAISGGAGASAVHAAAAEAATVPATAAAVAGGGGVGGDAHAVVFLDIDGVLLPFGKAAAEGAADGDPARRFPRSCLAALSRLLEASGARIVLSSTWRVDAAAVEQILANFHAYSADEPERGAALGRIAQLTETTDPATHSERQWEIHAWLQAADAHMHLYREGSQQGLAHSKDSQRGFTYLQGQRVPPSLHPPMPLHPGTPARAPVGGARRRRATRGAAQCRARCRVRRPRREDGEPRGPHRGRGRARHLAACAAADIG